jgi:hypothetical protein
MKRMTTLKKVAAIVCMTILTSSAILAMPKKSISLDGEPKETEKTIRNYFKFPQILIPYYDSKKATAHKVEVLFTTDNKGKVNFALAKTEDPLLKQEIEKQFSNLRLLKVKQNTVHSVVLNFSLQ